MSKPVIQIGSEVREMTDAEYAQWQIDCDVVAERQKELAAKAKARESAISKLADLGLTTAEISALVGQ